MKPIVMKTKVLLILLTVLFVQNSFAQEDDYMLKITKKACECLSELKDTENITTERLGLCMLAEAGKYKDELLRDYNIDMMNIDETGEELGRLIGLKMITVCPEVMMSLADIKDEDDYEETLYSAQGKVRSITKEDFIVFSIKTEDGRTTKFHWLTFIQSDFDLQNNYESLKGKTIDLEYDIYEFYDAKLGDYRNYNIIESITIVD
ncbi:hypothetical protein [Bizionia paragorgiae]|uniref:Uncharacterized protein n=1 Tax=Bizionia paragorgiae TaxID=283786 RepID=A0A1H3XPR0_BIZPA|nr:hypothetical protein [Bizionia paragorgiae]SEA01445.1 hypothetical protein SAMN04487990_105117 [Bizionia paragorgiae]